MKKVFKVADIRELERKVSLGEISYSRMVEEMNERSYLTYSKGEKLPIHGVTHRYFNLDEAKPENGKPCIVNNSGDNYHIAFWDEKVNGFVNQTGYLQKEFNRWLYLPINGG